MLGEQYSTGCIFIKAMDVLDLAVLPFGQEMKGSCVGKRVFLHRLIGVSIHAGRLVENQHMIILIQHVNFMVCRLYAEIFFSKKL
ncbi:Uncharacterised protein [Mycobacteroides abscessus subsp. abscessus]|nr:Uncharacterised protein [Mycobacteroides abscessus subsp. abscessus]